MSSNSSMCYFLNHESENFSLTPAKTKFPIRNCCTDLLDYYFKNTLHIQITVWNVPDWNVFEATPTKTTSNPQKKEKEKNRLPELSSITNHQLQLPTIYPSQYPRHPLPKTRPPANRLSFVVPVPRRHLHRVEEKSFMVKRCRRSILCSKHPLV